MGLFDFGNASAFAFCAGFAESLQAKEDNISDIDMDDGDYEEDEDEDLDDEDDEDLDDEDLYDDEDLDFEDKKSSLEGGTINNMYFTITGCSHFYGCDVLEKGMKVDLKKEHDNKYDSEAILVKIKGMGKCGYVANSPTFVRGESMSAGRLYDKIGETAEGKIVVIIPCGAIGMITNSGLVMNKTENV